MRKRHSLSIRFPDTVWWWEEHRIWADLRVGGGVEEVRATLPAGENRGREQDREGQQTTAYVKSHNNFMQELFEVMVLTLYFRQATQEPGQDVTGNGQGEGCSEEEGEIDDCFASGWLGGGKLVKIMHCIYTCFEEIAYPGAFGKQPTSQE